jgi:hypothetical protein
MLRMGRDIVEDEGCVGGSGRRRRRGRRSHFLEGGAVFMRTMGPQRFYGTTAPTPSRNTRQGVAARRQGGTKRMPMSHKCHRRTCRGRAIRGRSG